MQLCGTCSALLFTFSGLTIGKTISPSVSYRLLVSQIEVCSKLPVSRRDLGYTANPKV